jgi:rhamnose transport system substrate-binding protein
MKKTLLLLFVCLLALSLAACGSKPVPAETSKPVEGGDEGGTGLVFGFASKTTADPMFIGTYDGFKMACDDLGIECIYRGTDDASAEKEIEIINQFISQGVDGIAVIAADYDALEAVLQQAMDAGIAVLSVDSAANPASRQVHIDFCNTVTLGRKMFQSAAKICNYEGQVTVLSGDPRVAVFADFEEGIRLEFKENLDKYGKIELVEEFYYGYDLPDESTQEANAMFKNYPNVDVVICPTTVSILAAAKIIQDNGMDVKVTGIGLPSEMVTYFDNGICPEMWLWDIYEYGYLTAYALQALVNGDITGATGETFESGKLGSYTIEDHADGGTMVMLSEGLLFDSSNIHEWVDKL